MTTHPLRDYQIKIIQDIEDAIAKGHRRIMLQLPTGAGKTRCFVELTRLHRNTPYADNVRNCLIVAHRKELIDQAAQALSREGIREWEIGIIKSGERANQHRGIQVASVQSLVRRDFPLAGLVIIDEAHHAIADTYQKVIHHPQYEDAVILGVTATPERTDGRGFRDSFDVLIQGPTVKELTTQRYLCPYKLYAYTRDRINTNYVKTQAGDYQLNQLADAVMDSEVRADLVKTWKKQALGKRTVVFAVNVQLSKEYAALYNASSGYKAEHIDGRTHKDDRKAILERFKSGKTTILCNCNIVTEGFDLPEMECIQIVRPTQSKSFWLQMVGRSLRISEGKTHAIILDHTDNYKRLGLPDNDYGWSLDSHIRPSSFIPYNAGRESPQDERRQREIEHLEGELIEVANNSNLQTPTKDMRTAVNTKIIRIDNVNWEVDSRLAAILNEKLKQLEELKRLLVEKEQALQESESRAEELQNLLNNASARADGLEQILEDISVELDQIRVDAAEEVILKDELLDALCNLENAQFDLVEVNKDLTNNQELLNTETSRADESEKALKKNKESLTQMREKYKAQEIDFKDTSNDLAKARKLLKSSESHANGLEKKLKEIKEEHARTCEEFAQACHEYASKKVIDNKTIEDFSQSEIESRLESLLRAIELLKVYGLSLEKAGINTRMNAVEIMRTTIAVLNKKIDFSDKSDEYVTAKFDAYCEIVAERIAYEASQG